MARRALALAASLALDGAVPATARNINADNLYTVHNLQSTSGRRRRTAISSTAGASSPARRRRGGSPTTAPTSRPSTTAPPARSRTHRDRARRADRHRVQRLGGRLQGQGRRPATPPAPGSSSPPMTARSPAGTASGRRRSARRRRPTRSTSAWRSAAPAAPTTCTRPTSRPPASTSSTAPSRPAPGRRDFTDPGLPAGYAPFGIQNIGGEIFVAYAKQDADGDEEIDGEGLGLSSAPSGPTARSTAASRPPATSTPRGAWPWRRRTSASSAATCSSATSATAGSTPSADRERLGGARRDQGHRPPADLDRRPVGHRLRQRRHTGSGPTNTLFFAAGPDDETHGPVRVDHRARTVTG